MSAHSDWKEDAMNKSYFEQLDKDGPGDEDENDEEDADFDDF